MSGYWILAWDSQTPAGPRGPQNATEKGRTVLSRLETTWPRWRTSRDLHEGRKHWKRAQEVVPLLSGLWDAADLVPGLGRETGSVQKFPPVISVSQVWIIAVGHCWRKKRSTGQCLATWSPAENWSPIRCHQISRKLFPEVSE